MARRKTGRPIDGWLNFDKPRHMSSAQAVAKVRHLFQARKVGHAGTLDPLASGVLPLAFGAATKTISFMQEATKIYEIEIMWGAATATDDSEGAVIAESDNRPDRAAIEAALPDFIGTIEQVPPQYSAIKQDGKRAYALARAGQVVPLVSRKVRIDTIAILATTPHSLTLQVQCGKGVYMRALARDLGQCLGTYGHICALRRTKVGIFDENSIITLEKLSDLRHSAPDLTTLEPSHELSSETHGQMLDASLSPIHTVLADIPALVVGADFASRLRHGLTIPQDGLPDISQEIIAADRFCVYDANGLVAICYLEAAAIKSMKVFPSPDIVAPEA
ncbi:MAG: tRNA pseudouridine(55) synthase TruB [Alphaproteobacteria bacterium]|nr:tRNA pseudouridine(55) synthase TruB [Alphaproteobacteria bacterium]